MQSDAIFKNMPVGRAILTLAVPSVFSVLVMILYNMADLFFVARLGDNAQVAAVSIVGPIFSLLSAVSTMVGAGGCTLLARYIGAGEHDNARTVSSLSAWICVLCGTAALVSFNLFCRPLLSLLGTTAEIWGYAENYFRILSVGAPLMLFSTGFAMLLRGEGAIKEGFFIGLLGTGINMILDPVLILLCGMGVSGAALATVAGNLTSCVCVLWYIRKRSAVLTVRPSYALRRPSLAWRIILLGLPNAASSLLSGFASTFSNQLLSGYGTDAIAAMGAAGKLTMLTGLVQMGIVMGVQPMMAYCYGAGDAPRQRELLKKLSQFTFGLGTGFTVVCYIARHSLLGLFLQAGDAVRLAELFSIWLLLSGPVIGLYYIASNYLQATGSALSATVVSVLRQGALLIPLLYLMHAGFGLPGIAIAHALADLIATGIGMALFLRQYRRVCQSAVK